MTAGLAWRNVRRQGKRSAVTVSSLALGLAFTVFYVAVQSGLDYRLTQDSVKLTGGHISIEHPKYRASRLVGHCVLDTDRLRASIEQLPGTVQTKLLVMGMGLAMSGTGSANVMITGVEPGIEPGLSPLIDRMISGRYLDESDSARIVIGNTLARRLNVREDGRIVLIAADAEGVLTESLVRVSGIFDTGVEEIDGFIVHVPIGFARDLFTLPGDAATQLGVILKSPSHVPRSLGRMRNLLEGGPAVAYPWQDILPEISSALAMVKGSLYVMEALLIALVLFTVFNTVLMSSLEREKEFAVQLALGTPPASLKMQLFQESAILGGIGCGLGLIAGAIISLGYRRWGVRIDRVIGDNVLFFGFGADSVIQPRLSAAMLAALGGIVLAAALAVSLYPMRRVDRIAVAETLR